MDMLATPWANAQVAYLLVVQQAPATVEDNTVATKVVDPIGYNEIFTIKDSEMIDTFSPKSYMQGQRLHSLV